MYEYKTEICKIKEAEKVMNDAAKEGWRVISVTPDIARGFGLVLIFERKADKLY